MKSVSVNTNNSNEIQFASTVTKDAVTKTLQHFEGIKKSPLRTCFVDDGNCFQLWIDRDDLQFIRVHSVLSETKRKLMFNSHLIIMLRSLIYGSGAIFYFAFNVFRKRYLPSRIATGYFQEHIGKRYLKDVFNFLYTHKSKWNGNSDVFKKLLIAVTRFFSMNSRDEQNELVDILNLNSFNRFINASNYAYISKRHRLWNTDDKAYESLSVYYNCEMDFYTNEHLGKRKRVSKKVSDVMLSAKLHYSSMLQSSAVKHVGDDERAALGLLLFIDNLYNSSNASVGKTKMFYYLKNIIKNNRLKNLDFVQMCDERSTYVVENKMFPLINI